MQKQNRRPFGRLFFVYDVSVTLRIIQLNVPHSLTSVER